MPNTLFSELETRQARLKDRPTESERLFNARLRFANIRFEFQVIIPPYIVDFVVPKRMLIIELDGSSHNDRQEYDDRRTRYLERRGFTVVRVPNHMVETWAMKRVRGFPRCQSAYQRVMDKIKNEYLTIGLGPPPPMFLPAKARRVRVIKAKDRQREVLQSP